MDDLISRQAAIDAVNHALDRETILFSFVRKVAISALKRLPSADVAPVVRCKDCKHLYKDGECPLRTWYTHVEDDFCSYGERREE